MSDHSEAIETATAVLRLPECYSGWTIQLAKTVIAVAEERGYLLAACKELLPLAVEYEKELDEGCRDDPDEHNLKLLAEANESIGKAEAVIAAAEGE